METVFSGIQPTSEVHLGNYIGAIANWVDFQSNPNYKNIYCIVDLHALTVFTDPKDLQNNTLNLAALLLACGIDPKKSLLFLQSSNPHHSELAWLLNCVARMGWLNRMTQFKDKVGKNQEKSSVGLFAYPNLMAADILLYDANKVPTGADQKQHIELCRDIAEKFNKDYANIFTIPQPLINEHTARIMSLKDPTKKMSKSDEVAAAKILFSDSNDAIHKKIMKATTDSHLIKHDIPLDERAGFNNLLNIYTFCAKTTKKELITKYEGQGFANFKQDLAEQVIGLITPIREKYFEFLANKDYVVSILKDSKEKAKKISSLKIQKVRESMGLYTF